MVTKVFVNGAAGRIGRQVTYNVAHTEGLKLVGINDPLNPKVTDKLSAMVANYREADDVHGTLKWDVGRIGEKLFVNDKEVAYFSETDVAKMPLRELGVDIVIEASGFYTGDRLSAHAFLDRGAKRVIMTYPAKVKDATLICGVNHTSYDPARHFLISNASCTTKALAMPLDVLRNMPGTTLDAMFMDTVHAVTQKDEVLKALDNIVTTKTGAAQAVAEVFPELAGKMHGLSERVHVVDGSIANMSVVLYTNHPLTSEDLRRRFEVSPAYQTTGGINDRMMIRNEPELNLKKHVRGTNVNAVIPLSKIQVLPLAHAPAGKFGYHVFIVSGYDNELGSAMDPVLLARYMGLRS